jgi:hypothetical protein
MSFVQNHALEALRGAALFYPSAGEDWHEPLEFFAPAIAEFWFVDVAYFTRQPADVVEPLVQDSAVFDFQGFTLDGPALARPERRVDRASGQSYPFIEPCTRTEVYLHRPTNMRIRVHRRRGFGQCSISLVPDVGVFFHRGDSPGEGGSNVYWLSRRWFPQVSVRLRAEGLVVTDGCLAHVRPLRKIRRQAWSAQRACDQAAHFKKWGRRWTCVGWIGRRKTPVWQLTAA